MQVIYKAFDGREFGNEDDCMAHEREAMEDTLASRMVMPGPLDQGVGVYGHGRRENGNFVLDFQDGSTIEFEKSRIVGYNKGRTAAVLFYSRVTSQEGGV